MELLVSKGEGRGMRVICGKGKRRGRHTLSAVESLVTERKPRTLWYGQSLLISSE